MFWILNVNAAVFLSWRLGRLSPTLDAFMYRHFTSSVQNTIFERRIHTLLTSTIRYLAARPLKDYRLFVCYVCVCVAALQCVVSLCSCASMSFSAHLTFPRILVTWAPSISPSICLRSRASPRLFTMCSARTSFSRWTKKTFSAPFPLEFVLSTRSFVCSFVRSFFCSFP